MAGALMDYALVQKSHHIGMYLTANRFTRYTSTKITQDPQAVATTFKHSLKFTKSVSQSTLLSRIKGICYFHLASIESHLSNPDLNLAMTDAKNAIKLLQSVVDSSTPCASDYQLVNNLFNVSLVRHGYS